MTSRDVRLLSTGLWLGKLRLENFQMKQFTIKSEQALNFNNLSFQKQKLHKVLRGKREFWKSYIHEGSSNEVSCMSTYIEYVMQTDSWE